ncbi:MAG: hypothetical protein WBW80_15740, partial [Acidimicrobiales bacterium]
MNLLHVGAGVGGDDRRRVDLLTVWGTPPLPQTSDHDGLFVDSGEPLRLLRLPVRDRLPLVEAADGYEEASLAEGVAEQGLGRDGIGSRIE